MTPCYYIRVHCRKCGVYSAAVSELPDTCLKPNCSREVDVVARAKSSVNYAIPWVEGRRTIYWGNSARRERGDSMSHNAQR